MSHGYKSYLRKRSEQSPLPVIAVAAGFLLFLLLARPFSAIGLRQGVLGSDHTGGNASGDPHLFGAIFLAQILAPCPACQKGGIPRLLEGVVEIDFVLGFAPPRRLGFRRIGCFGLGRGVRLDLSCSLIRPPSEGDICARWAKSNVTS